jgi:hypothetical protein
MYCAALKVSRGKLVIFYLNDGVVEAYNAVYSRDLLRRIDQFEVEKRLEIEEALRLKDPLKASCVAGDPDLDWKCLTCQYWGQVQREARELPNRLSAAAHRRKSLRGNAP